MAVSAALVAATAAVSTGGSSPAVAADACTAPQLSDVMVSQGLPSYTALAAGKTTLVKLFLATPSCLPVGATVTVTGASLSVSSSAKPIDVQASLPLPPIGPTSTAPVANTASDLVFLVPGNAMQPQGTNTVTFAAEVDYQVQTATGTVADKVLFSTVPGTTNPIAATVLPNPDPLNLLVVPMGTSSSQYNAAEVQAGIDTLKRLYPVADSGGINAFQNAGMLNVGTTPYCANATSFSSTLVPALEKDRVIWNAANGTTAPSTPGAPHVTRVLGQIDQSISTGPSTTTGSTCADGYAQVGSAKYGDGTVAFGRVVSASTQGFRLTGSIDAMELAHTTGAVDPNYAFNAQQAPLMPNRADGSYHSFNSLADVTAPGRAYNLSNRLFLPGARSFMRYSSTNWYDAVTLGEQQDWDYLMCGLLPPAGTPGAPAVTPLQLTSCMNPGRMGYSAAAAVASYGGPDATSGTYAIAGATDGTAAGTDAYSSYSSVTEPDPQAPNSDYRLVQRNAQNQQLADFGVPVHFTAEQHNDADGGGTPVGALVGAFGVAVPAMPGATKLELVKRTPTGDTVLYTRTQQAQPPAFTSVELSGTTITVNASSPQPGQLRLDVLLACDNAPASPLVADMKPTATAGQSAVFVASYDTTMGCQNGHLAYHLTDGIQSANRSGSAVNGGKTATGEITAPYAGQKLLASQSIGLAGSATDSQGRPAASYRWSILRTTSTGAVTEFDVPAGQTTAIPPAGGWPLPGSYQAKMRAFDSSGALLTTVLQPFELLADSDGDGISDADENAQACFGPNASSDPTTATKDSDGDGYPNGTDPAPCVSANTVTVAFNPQSLYKSASGNVVTVYLSKPKPGVDLSKLTVNDLFITQIAGFSTRAKTGSITGLPAVAYQLTSPTTATVQFARRPLVDALGPVLGYMPVFVGTLDGAVRGTDPTYPLVFP